MRHAQTVLSHFGNFENEASEARPDAGAKGQTAARFGPRIWTRVCENRKFTPDLAPARICDSLSGAAKEAVAQELTLGSGVIEMRFRDPWVTTEVLCKML